MLLEQYKMLTNIEFLELFINCEDLYKKFDDLNSKIKNLTDAARNSH